MSRNIAVLGKGSLFTAVCRFLRERGFAPLTLEQLADHDVCAVVDVNPGVDGQKRQQLQLAEARISPQTPIYTSTLHRTATEIASWLSVPERVVGFSPLGLEQFPVLEVACPLQAEEVKGWDQHLRLAESWGKQVERVGDQPGLVFPRILSLLVNEAAFALSEGISSKEEIDTAMKKGTNLPFGPLEWADRVGIEQIAAVLEGMQREWGDDRYRPAPLLKKMIYAGYVGIAAGRGFYHYQDAKLGG
ncbi:3-hydroxyacyl-CoA dehydrogenase family protein [Thermoactinomyces sp. CICC 10521]|uniref:3-hydroxyacyl-CoA dehydrogenase family protein n=1 Tax=Thermoactinomyces sp. CICC 10521 TaxID=2767426 RepID=UPI0018DC3C36|nr:3-hydroxyacyl-CoA dehydrogenase family protein [Thermoactinomyces sp. CICC 10521]MBH8606385.1 3-hydroxybutyryl-CoA dehydrogenase [Thermoactinomyces sp. CICC 10521]